MLTRVYREDNHYLVAVRYPGQWNNLQDFVQPDNPDVLALYSQIGPDVWQCLNFVCQNISYKREVGELWQFPSETLAKRQGDCEDTSLLLCSLLRNAFNAHVALGSYQGYGHAWTVSEEGEILESTYTEARYVPDPEDYCPYCIFNESEVIELWPGALEGVFKIGRDEQAKLNLMAGT